MMDWGRYKSTNLEERNKVVKMTFLREELLFDIKDNAWVEGDVMPAEGDNVVHKKHQLQDICDDSNINRVNRLIELGMAECAEALSSLMKESVEDVTEVNDAHKDGGDFELVLAVPNDFPKTTIDVLVTYIHEYIVSRVLADRMRTMYPAAAANWEEKKETTLANIKRKVNARVGRVRRTQTPF